MDTTKISTALKGPTDGHQKTAPEKTGPPAFEVFETRVAANCGLSRDAVAELRKKHLQEDVDWAYVKKRVMYTLAGAAKLRAAVALPPDPEKDAVPDIAEQPDPVKLVVCRTFPKGNTHILEAHAPGKDPHDRANVVRVQVRSSANYVPGMELPAIHEHDDVYRVARPDPRWRGTW
jgi:hypothetical protein